MGTCYSFMHTSFLFLIHNEVWVYCSDTTKYDSTDSPALLASRGAFSRLLAAVLVRIVGSPFELTDLVLYLDDCACWTSRGTWAAIVGHDPIYVTCSSSMPISMHRCL